MSGNKLIIPKLVKSHHTKSVKAKLHSCVPTVSNQSDEDFDHNVEGLANTTSKICKQIVTWHHAQPD